MNGGELKAVGVERDSARGATALRQDGRER